MMDNSQKGMDINRVTSVSVLTVDFVIRSSHTHKKNIIMLSVYRIMHVLIYACFLKCFYSIRQ